MGAPTRSGDTRVLIANRGEIAVRIAQTVRDVGKSPVGVFVQADKLALHPRVMDVAVNLDALGDGAGYLDVPALIAAAKQTQARYIHPGYGFVSENPELAHACAKAGIVLVGPSAHAITTMGSKTAARAAMRAANVPTVPGCEALGSLEEATHEAQAMGYPVMLKAAAGGGGKGIRIVESDAELGRALRAVRSEAQSAFGDDTVYMEKALLEPRHIEVQVLADNHGNVFAVGERECSMQRRHQKIVEEAPAAALGDDVRERLCALACRAARAVDYSGAGTVEFLLDARGEAYFLEMNTRLQVEHPVTELCWGIDLVALQLKVAQGDVLRAEDIGDGPRGHAIEARLYAEDPLQQFLPAPGRIHSIAWPQGPGIRVDAGVCAGVEVTPHFDPMIAKIIAWAPTRELCRQRLMRAIGDTHVRGLVTNRSYLLALLEQPDFVAGRYHTQTISRMGAPERRVPPEGAPATAALVALVMGRYLREHRNKGAAHKASPGAQDIGPSRWQAAPWRLEAS